MVPTNELEGYKQASGARRLVVWTVIVLALATVAYLALRPADEQPVPDFVLPTLDGGRLSSAELHGSPVVLNFFASWCAPCREEAPLLERTWQAYKERGVRFVGVDIRDTPSDARRFVREFGLTYPIVRDEDQTLARALDVYGLPQTFFVDRRWRLSTAAEGDKVGKGRAGVVQLGAISRTELHTQIERLLQS
jgi:cytochrome c biogenesis protein CcmG/thiol:disulfide interchange protein DsbE